MNNAPDINCFMDHHGIGMMIKVCLDQCAISQLAIPRTKNGAIDELKSLMLNASDRNLLVCPVAQETLVETTALPLKCRVPVHELHCYLAGARDGSPLFAFKNMWKLINEETLALARAGPVPSAFELFRWHCIKDDRTSRKTATEHTAAKFQKMERVKAHQIEMSRQGPIPKPKKDLVILEHVSHVYRQVQRLLRAEVLCPKDHMGFGVGQYLVAQGITSLELMKLSEDILHHRWEAIPVIFNRTRLAAQLESELLAVKNSRKYKANDEFDISRLSVGLASADVVITDAAMAQLCRSAKASSWTHAKVFSVSESKEIVAYLENALSQSHPLKSSK